jgi:hypothetical protein
MLNWDWLDFANTDFNFWYLRSKIKIPQQMAIHLFPVLLHITQFILTLWKLVHYFISLCVLFPMLVSSFWAIIEWPEWLDSCQDESVKALMTLYEHEQHPSSFLYFIQDLAALVNITLLLYLPQWIFTPVLLGEFARVSDGTTTRPDFPH